jgi:hypothetical protein
MSPISNELAEDLAAFRASSIKMHVHCNALGTTVELMTGFQCIDRDN